MLGWHIGRGMRGRPLVTSLPARQDVTTICPGLGSEDITTSDDSSASEPQHMLVFADMHAMLQWRNA